MNPNPLLLIHGLYHLTELKLTCISMSVTKREHVFLADVFDSIAVMFSLTHLR